MNQIECLTSNKLANLYINTTESHMTRKNRQKIRQEKKKKELERIKNEASLDEESSIDMRKFEKDIISSIIEKMSFEEKDIIPDGHCLYRAFSDQLAVRHDIHIDYLQLRTVAASYIREHEQSFIPFLFNDETGEIRDVESYCNDIEHTAMWGGEVEIIALARAYKVNVELIQMKGLPLKINFDPDGETSFSQNKNTIKLSYYQHMYALGAHYNSLRDKVKNK
ncbi:hypothetical protein T552_00814 [Pneumocystis carinii B80]|uniref:OTU domain-containing protein n=1 Tax=Pneumocystis carinii (strain B80) TaxID=1408658 RepID=A0A0W4ZPR0_PNEC8|nr:hypothetical protein T552_00814 [Pneumocystis carinii B80]KTW30342.1 hypothetical protein T552_00814 [Pneumocystis carinii B80]